MHFPINHTGVLPRVRLLLVRLLLVALLSAGGLLRGSQAQAPTTGAAPAVQVGDFEVNGDVSATLALAERVLTGDRLTLDSGLSGERLAQNDTVVVVVTCAPRNNQTRVVVIAASSDSQTAEFYRNDIRTRIQKNEPIPPRAFPTGHGPVFPTTGSAPNMQVGGFNLQNDVLGASGTANGYLTGTESALTGANLTVGSRLTGERIAQNDNVVVVVTADLDHPPTPPLGLADVRVVVTAASTDAKTAEFYRNNVRARLNPSSPPVRIH